MSRSKAMQNRSSVAVMETSKGKSGSSSSPAGTATNFRTLSLKPRKTQFEKDLGNLERDRLCHLLRKDSRGNARQFWESLKAAALQNYESTEAAFLAFASPADCMMSLEQFQET
ncbi:unnamed protein product [Effrenium voratum]|nr:unnamed protein product [Effrenium voratum]